MAMCLVSPFYDVVVHIVHVTKKWTCVRKIFTFEYIELNYETREDNLQQKLYCASIISIIFADCQFYFPESPFFLLSLLFKLCRAKSEYCRFCGLSNKLLQKWIVCPLKICTYTESYGIKARILYQVVTFTTKVTFTAKMTFTAKKSKHRYLKIVSIVADIT